LEKEKSEVSLKIDIIQGICSQAQKQYPEGPCRPMYTRIGDLCKDIFQIQENSSKTDISETEERKEEEVPEEREIKSQSSQPKSQFSSKKNSIQNISDESEKMSDNGRDSKKPSKIKIEMLGSLPSKDYNKLIYSEMTIESNSKTSRDQNQLMKASIDKNILKRKASSQRTISNRTNETNETNNSKYQINYDNSDMGQSSTGESEEFNNGMDVLLQEYMTDKMNKKRSTLNPEGTKPPYNTEKQQEVDLNDYILKKEEHKSEPNNKFDLEKEKGSDEKEDIGSGLKETVLGNESQSLSQNWPTSRNNHIEDADLDRESGFEDIVERLIGVVCLEDVDMRKRVCKIYNRIFKNEETEILGTNEEMLRSLQESQNFKNKMIECLSESEKQGIAVDALTIVKDRLTVKGNTLSVGVRSTYGSLKKKSKGEESIEDVMIKLDRMKEENKFLVSELERQNKFGKSSAAELEKLREEVSEIRQKNEELVEENSVLEQRLDLFDRENQTEMSEYNDEYNQFEPMQHRLSNNMLIIQEADEEYEMDSMMSGQDLQDVAQKMLLKKFEKADQMSIDNESHYSFFKDYGKSEDEGEGDFDTKNLDSLPEIQPKIIKRRMTESGRRSMAKDQVNKYLEDLAQGRYRKSRRYRKRNTIGNVGMNLIRKKLEKSESYNVGKSKPEEFDFGGALPQKLNRTLEEPSNKSDENKKIKLKRLISDPLCGESPKQTKTENGVLVESDFVGKSQDPGTMVYSENFTPEPMISFISQDKSAIDKFNFSKNFEDNVGGR
jgi:hypothetical protein